MRSFARRKIRTVVHWGSPEGAEYSKYARVRLGTRPEHSTGRGTRAGRRRRRPRAPSPRAGGSRAATARTVLAPATETRVTVQLQSRHHGVPPIGHCGEEGAARSVAHDRHERRREAGHGRDVRVPRRAEAQNVPGAEGGGVQGDGHGRQRLRYGEPPACAPGRRTDTRSGCSSTSSSRGIRNRMRPHSPS